MTSPAANTISTAPSSTLNATPMKADRRSNGGCAMYPMLKSAMGTASIESTSRNQADSPSTEYPSEIADARCTNSAPWKDEDV